MKTSRFAHLIFLAGALTSLFIFVYSQTPLQIGYAVITADSEGSVPVGTALFSSTTSQGVLVWEAGVAAVEPLSAGRIFVDQRDDGRTALALASPSEEGVIVALILRDASGAEVDRRDEPFAPHQHQSLFVDELFSTTENFSGSLTFQTQQEGEKVAAVTLRQNTNLQGEQIFATLPVVDLSLQSSVESIIFPQVGAGVGLSTQLVLLNPTDQSISGQIQLFDSQGAALESQLDETAGASFPYRIEPNGTFSGELTSNSGTNVGYAVVTPEEESRTPSGSAIFQFTSGDSVISEAGVAAVLPTTAARIFVDNVETRTGVAIANADNPETLVTFTLLNSNGSPLETTTRLLAASGHLSIFADELFSQAGEGFSGLMEITSPVPVAPVTLKLTTNQRAQPILTTLPLADLTRTRTAGSVIFPQIGYGDFESGAFATRLLLINGEAESGLAGRLNFFQSDGSALSVPLGEETDSEFSYLIPTGGGRRLQPGIMTAVSQIILDPANPSATEVVVNEGNAVQLTPRVLDNQGNDMPGVTLSYSSLSPEIATVDTFGMIEGKQAGFSTLTVSAGNRVQAATIAVVKVSSGTAGFQITGVVQDLARRLYLANTTDHTILLAEDLETTPQLYAGVPQTPGLQNTERLQSLFRGPAYLSLDQASGSLYVSDGSNHVIRLVEPGPAGRVRNLAGTGQAGADDGSLNQASFNNPQGITLDNRGNLWIVDTGNHVIRRINLLSGLVQTIAGQVGVTGLVDGMGEEARFNSPRRIAIENESVAQQLERERRGEPPPAVSFVVADTGNGVIRRVRGSGEVDTLGAFLESPGSSSLEPFDLVRAMANFTAPTGVAVDPFGTIYVTEPNSGQVRAILQNGDVVPVAQPDTFTGPEGIVVRESGKVVVADSGRSAQQITYGEPAITQVAPGQINSRGGETVTLTGANFSNDTVVVTAGVVLSEVSILDTQTLAFIAPPLPSGLASVTIQNRAGLAQNSILVEAVPLGKLPPQHITTVAGGTTFGGEGSPATEVAMRPEGVAVNSTGDVFIADSTNNRIRKVDGRTGVTITIAGTGRAGMGGDGELATAADLDNPTAVIVDVAGDLLIGDTFNGLIRKVDSSTGIITTVAGGGEFDFLGEGGPATEAYIGFLAPGGIATDPTRQLLYISDIFFNRVRKVDLASDIITTFAGGGRPPDGVGDGGPGVSAAFDEPGGIALDGDGNLFVADHNNHRVRRVDVVTDVITTVAGSGLEAFSGDGGAASAASLAGPIGLSFDHDGDLFIVDSYNGRVRRVEADTQLISTVAGNGGFDFSGDGGPATEAELSSPESIAVDAAGNLFIADTENSRVRRVDNKTNFMITLAGSGQTSALNDDGPATVANLSSPEDIAVDSAGNLYITDSGHIRVRKVDVNQTISTVAGGGDPDDELGDGGPATNAEFCSIVGIAVDHDGNVFVADFCDHRVRRVDAQTQVITTVAGSGQAGFSGDGGPATAAELDCPNDVTVDPDGNLYIADTLNHRIRRLDVSTGIVTTVAGNGTSGFSGDNGPASEAGLNDPVSVAVDVKGHLYIADIGNERVRKVDSDGIITTVAVRLQAEEIHPRTLVMGVRPQRPSCFPSRWPSTMKATSTFRMLRGFGRSVRPLA